VSLVERTLNAKKLVDIYLNSVPTLSEQIILHPKETCSVAVSGLESPSKRRVYVGDERKEYYKQKRKAGGKKQ
jgi:hypothetical protein